MLISQTKTQRIALIIVGLYSIGFGYYILSDMWGSLSRSGIDAILADKFVVLGLIFPIAGLFVLWQALRVPVERDRALIDLRGRDFVGRDPDLVNEWLDAVCDLKATGKGPFRWIIVAGILLNMLGGLIFIILGLICTLTGLGLYLSKIGPKKRRVKRLRKAANISREDIMLALG